VGIDDRRLGLLIFLVKLEVLGLRKGSISLAQFMIGGSGILPPPCSFDLAVVSTSRDYLEFVVKKNHPGEDWFKIGSWV
jgi:hypothetical protein